MSKSKKKPAAAPRKPAASPEAQAPSPARPEPVALPTPAATTSTRTPGLASTPPATPIRPSPGLELASGGPTSRTSPRSSRCTACYVDFENFLYTAQRLGHGLDVAKLARQLNRLSREVCGDSWAHNAVYASWDSVASVARHAQDEWAMVGWRTVAVPAREDYQSRRMVKNLVDFVMSLDILEDARDRPWDHFFIASGDADFCEVAERLKRLRKRVTVVALQANLSMRLQEAADDYVVCSLEELAGGATSPPRGYRQLAEVRDPATDRLRSEDPYQVLRRMVRQAEKDQGKGPVLWRVVKEEYLERVLPMPGEELDRFVRDLAEAGFVNLVTRRDRQGRAQSYISIPQ